MLKYSKVTNPETKEVSIANSGTQWVISQGFTEQEVEQSDKDGGWYLKGYAPMKTDEEKAAEERNSRIKAIKTELDALDKKRIRAMCEPSEYTKGLSWLEYYNNQARELRAELNELAASTSSPLHT